MIDLQNGTSNVTIALAQAGISNIKHPVQIIVGDTSYTTTANFTLAVAVEPQQRATHMSRFVELLNSRQWYMSISCIAELLDLIADKLQSQKAYVRVDFDFLKAKKAPISQLSGYLDYKIQLIGDMQQQKTLQAILKVPVTTLCPCSKAISAYGAHNQRTLVTATIDFVKTAQNDQLEELIVLIEQEASCELYSVLKRTDEQFVTEKAYDNPKFVEDLARDVAKQFKQLPYIKKYHICAESLESIHNHCAYAIATS